MEMSGEERIAAPRERVWAALNNPKVLRRCIPGCEALEATSPTEFVATLKLKLGPISTSVKCNVTLSDLKPPESYKISVEGSGGFAASVKSSADVSLAEVDGGETLLTYKTSAKIGGKLALLGSKLIESSSRKLATQFFTKLGKVIAKTAA
jgi:carbon monoxide dehydrogenase subunit G